MNLSTVNNFDLIRLFAAVEVAIIHASVHLDYSIPALKLLSFFPGVPIFFFISGLLIFSSYEKSRVGSNSLVNFFTKRFLRLYPALIFCFLFSVVLLAASGYLAVTDITLSELMIWTFTSLTFFQFFNPEFLREFGVGAINGSLWTISVELQFYLLTPLIFWLMNRRTAVVVLLVLFFALLNVLNGHFNAYTSAAHKLVGVSFVPWVYMFLLGASLASRSHLIDSLRHIDTRLVLLSYTAIWWVSEQLSLGWGNAINPLAYGLLAVLVLKAAYSTPTLSDRWLRRNDISYGIYIFHMPIINFLIYKNISGPAGVAIALASTTVMAIISWVLVEKPSLRMRNKTRDIEPVKL